MVHVGRRGRRVGGLNFSSRFARRGETSGYSSALLISADSLEDLHFRELSRAQSYAYEFPDPVCKSSPGTRVEELINGGYLPV